MKKAIAILLLVMTVCLLLVSCDNSLRYGSYTRKNDTGRYGDFFTITLREDGSCSYSPTSISNYIADCTYTVEGDRIIIVDTQIPALHQTATRTYVFEHKNGRLIFLADESDEFLYITLPDRATFTFTDNK